MKPEESISPEEQMTALELARQGMQRATGYGARLLGTYCIILGLLLGGLAALLQVYRPDENFVGFIVIMALFVASVVAMSLAYGKLYRSLPRGHSKMYLRGFFLSMALYGIAIALLASHPTGWVVMVLTWIIVAAPLCLTGIGMVRK